MWAKVGVPFLFVFSSYPALGHHSPPKPMSIRTPISGGVDEDGHDKVSKQKITLHAFSIYVGNLPMDASKKWIHDLFIHFGSITDA